MTTRFIHRLRLLAAPLFMLLLALVTSTAAFADSTPGTEVVNGAGSVTESITAPTIPGATLAGVDQSINYTLPLTVVDATGTGNGWNLTVTSTTFTTGGESPHTLATSASRIESVATACVSGSTCTDPSAATPITYPLALPAAATAPSAVKFFSADAATGLGKFTITPTISIAIPANTYASSSGYSSTITVAVVSGP